MWEASLIFSTKSISVFCYKVLKQFRSWPLNNLFKLMMLWTTGPRFIVYLILEWHKQKEHNCSVTVFQCKQFSIASKLVIPCFESQLHLFWNKWLLLVVRFCQISSVGLWTFFHKRTEASAYRILWNLALPDELSCWGSLYVTSLFLIHHDSMSETAHKRHFLTCNQIKDNNTINKLSN